MEGSPSTRPASNLKLALDAYDAQQRRSAALQEAQRIGNLIHIQEQQLVAARHLAKQRKLALRRQQQQQQQQQQQLALSQSSPPTTVQCQPTLESLPECVVEEEDDEQAPGALVQPAAEPVAADSTQTTPRIRAEQPQSAPCVRPPVRFAAHRRRPQEPFATVWPRTHWKPDSHATHCDNITCCKPFSYFDGVKRHHCRHCGNVFCDACTSHREVLYDMSNIPWQVIPEDVLASLFLADSDDDEPEQLPASPAATYLSASFESGSSFGSQDGYFARPASRSSASSRRSSKKAKDVVYWEVGSAVHVPYPIPASWRDVVLDNAKEERVCDDCHAILWGKTTPTNEYYTRRALVYQREEIAWALWLQGLDQWDVCLRKHGLTFKPTPEHRKYTRSENRRRGSNVSSNTATTTESGVSQGSLPTSATADKKVSVDIAGRPIHVELYAWPTPPPCIRFTSTTVADMNKQFTNPIRSTLKPDPTPSIFGMHKADPRFMPSSRPPMRRIPTDAELEAEEERRETELEKRYKAAIEQFLSDAYAFGELRECFRRKAFFPSTAPPTKMDVFKTDVARTALDICSWWRGDVYGGW